MLTLIFSKKNTKLNFPALSHLPASCVESAHKLEEQIDIYTKYDVFPESVLRSIIQMLKNFNDEGLISKIQNDDALGDGAGAKVFSLRIDPVFLFYFLVFFIFSEYFFNPNRKNNYTNYQVWVIGYQPPEERKRRIPGFVWNEVGKKL